MELKVFWRTLRRRWYLTVVVLALMVGGTAYVVRDVGPTYKAEGSALVFPPASSVKADGGVKTAGNPYLELAGVNQARDVVIRTLKSRTVQEEWAEDFPDMEYEATPDFTNSAPIILFTVEGGTSESSAAGLDDLMSRVPAILLDLQDGLGLEEQSYVTARKLTQDATPAVVRKSQIRAGLVAGVGIGGLGLMLLALVDSLLTALARRREQRALARRAAEEAASEAAEMAALEAAERAAAERAEAQRVAEAERAAEADADEDEELGAPVYTYRVPVESELAVSPARSRWARDAGPRSREGWRLRGGETTVDVRTRATGRKR